MTRPCAAAGRRPASRWASSTVAGEGATPTSASGAASRRSNTTSASARSPASASRTMSRRWTCSSSGASRTARRVQPTADAWSPIGAIGQPHGGGRCEVANLVAQLQHPVVGQVGQQPRARKCERPFEAVGASGGDGGPERGEIEVLHPLGHDAYPVAALRQPGRHPRPGGSPRAPCAATHALPGPRRRARTPRRRGGGHADPDGPATRPAPNARSAPREAPAACPRTPPAALRTAGRAGSLAPNVREPPLSPR